MQSSGRTVGYWLDGILRGTQACIESVEKGHQSLKRRKAAPQDESEAVRALATLTAPQKIAAENFFKQIEARIAPRLKVKQEEDGCTEIAYDFADNVIGLVLVASEIGTADLDFYHGLVDQLANAASTRQKVSEKTLNFMLAVIKGIKPRDQVETMLAAQMAAVHLAIMTFARRLANVDNIPQQDSAERAFNKLLRTFTTQMEALKRYRTSGEQKVTVQHVSVARADKRLSATSTRLRVKARRQKRRLGQR